MNNLRELLKASFENHKDKPVLGFVNEPFLTYGEFWSKVLAISAFLENRNIRKGDKVALLSANQPNWGVVYFGIVSTGAVVVPILPDFHEDEIENIINHSESKAVFVSDGLYGKVKSELFGKLEFVATVDRFVLVEKDLSQNEIDQKEAAIKDIEQYNFSDEI